MILNRALLREVPSDHQLPVWCSGRRGCSERPNQFAGAGRRGSHVLRQQRPGSFDDELVRAACAGRLQQLGRSHRLTVRDPWPEFEAAWEERLLHYLEKLGQFTLPPYFLL